jgi:hypothetical protein
MSDAPPLELLPVTASANHDLDPTAPWYVRLRELEQLAHQLQSELTAKDERIAQLENEVADARVALVAVGANAASYLRKLEGGEYDGWAPAERGEATKAS